MKDLILDLQGGDFGKHLEFKVESNGDVFIKKGDKCLRLTKDEFKLLAVLIKLNITIG